MIEACVALLRGINVGTAKRIAMADLRRVFEDLGYRDVRTLLNSGNVVFTPCRMTDAATASRIEKAIADRLGVATRVTVLPASELAKAVRENPLASLAAHPSRFLIMVLRDASSATRLKPLLGERWAPEAIALRGRFAYLWCAKGIGKGPLWMAVCRQVGEQGTARNLTTMIKLSAMDQA